MSNTLELKAAWLALIDHFGEAFIRHKERSKDGSFAKLRKELEQLRDHELALGINRNRPTDRY